MIDRVHRWHVWLQLEECGDLETDAPEIIEEFQKAEKRKVLFQACYL